MPATLAQAIKVSDWSVGEREVMSDEMLLQLLQFQRYTEELRGVIAEAQRAAPTRVEGCDRSRSITVLLGADGLPESITAAATWAQRLGPASFGPAVVEAGSAALEKRMAAWGRALDETDWQRKIDQVDMPFDQAPQQAVLKEVPPTLRRDTAQKPPRSLDVVTEDMIRAFDQIPVYARVPKLEAKGIGSAAQGALTITLTAGGIASCEVRPTWVSQQHPRRVNGALATALADARSEFAQAAEPNQTEPLQELLGEVFALLEDPKRLG